MPLNKSQILEDELVEELERLRDRNPDQVCIRLMNLPYEAVERDLERDFPDIKFRKILPREDQRGIFNVDFYTVDDALAFVKSPVKVTKSFETALFADRSYFRSLCVAVRLSSG